MASTLLEETRQYHEDIERLERLIVKDFKAEPKTHKEKLLQGHRVRQMLETLQQRSERLGAIYEDTDGARKEEIASLRGDDVFSNFYDRLKDMRDYHRRFSTDDLTGGEDDAALVGTAPQVAFSGEEGFGRFLDLHEHHQAWQNAKFGAQVDYYSYVSSLATHLDEIPRAQRSTAAYRRYLDSLVGYLSGFFQRTQPLAQLDKQWKRLNDEFNARWEAGEEPGWEDRGEGPGGAANGGSANGGGGVEGSLDLDAFDSADELEVLGLEALKTALAALGLKCGGTLRQRAERLMSTKGKSLEELDPSLFAKGPRPAASLAPEERAKAAASTRALALQEARFRRLCKMLSSVIADTLGRVEKRAAQTYEELLAEAEAEEEEDVALAGEGWDEEEEEDEYIYNPLKLPLGWDGKPIPYWLYKLHGLNLEFKCEICGGASYWGRRAFERHFTEARHQGGMKALGIPNSKHFFEVTTIVDALALWRSMQDKQTGTFKEDDEEYEDGEGNVFSKKVYQDLKRQGLL